MSEINYEREFQNPGNNNREINIENVPQIELPQLKKKNRTLQFYKFLFYSMKIEVKVHEFYDLVRFSNQSEISLWILSIILYFNSPQDFKNILVWIHLLHVIRGVMGFLILLKLPRSYKVVEAMKVIPEKEMETKLFNDLARDVVKREVVEKMEGMKCWLIIYFILTFANFIFDVIDFLYVLANVDRQGISNNYKVVLITYLIIAFLYIAIDLAYVFWTSALRFTFPPTYLEPINQAFSGMLQNIKMRFKIGKKETNIIEEAAVQNQNQNQINANVGQPNVRPEQIQIDIGGGKSNFQYQNPSKNLYPEKYIASKENNEEELDR